MKKIAKLIATSLMPLLVCSCDKINNSEEYKYSSSENIVNSSDAIKSDSSSTNISVEDSSNKPQIEIGKNYNTAIWDSHVETMLEYVLGEDFTKVPAFIAPSYTAIVGYATIKEQQTLVFQIECFGVNSSSATKLYGEKLEESGFLLSSENSCGYIMKDYSSDIFVGYQLMSGKTPRFVLQAYVLQTRELTWNQEVVNQYADTEVPVFNAPCYEISYDQYYDRIVVLAEFVGKNAANDYISTLRMNRYTVIVNDSSGGTQLVDPTGYLTITVYQTYGDYNCDALYIAISNAWPTYGILAYSTFTHFPKLTSYTASYDGYSYLDTKGNGNESDYVLCIYYINASTTDYSNYIEALEEFGYYVQRTDTSETNFVTTYLTATRDKWFIESVKVIYKISTNEICIVISQEYQVRG